MGSLYTVIYLIFFFFGMSAFSLLINSILLRFVKTLGTKNQPGAIVRWSEQTKPAIGGLTFFIIFFMTLSVYSVLFNSNDVFNSRMLIGLMAAATLAFVMGLTDDAYNTRPILKFLVQIICGVILLQADSGISFFENKTLNDLLTIIWVVGIMNSINMLDNMDGIATSVSAFVVVGALGYIVMKGDITSVNFFLLVGILASLTGFLFFNWNPSSMYMGDTGSQFLGVILAYIGIHYCWNAESVSGVTGNGIGIAALLTVFALPIIDTTIVTINRLRKGQSPFVGGKDHSTHHLSYHGYSDRQVGIIFCVLSSIFVTAYLFLIYFLNNDNAMVILGIYFVSFLIVFVRLFVITEKNARKKRDQIPADQMEKVL
jgi:UDP-GlcNAc:undecaprenyl-phosphate GlcNAc-1-phosphate transferase